MDKCSQEEFDVIIKPLCQNEKVKLLHTFKQHGDVDRLTHSLNVAKYSFLIGKRFGLDCKALARGGLLHDLYHTERFSLIKNRRTKVFSHAAMAETLARELFDITEKEANIIRAHMFPISCVMPKSKEAWIVLCMDKWSTWIELYDTVFRPRLCRKKEFEVCCRYVFNEV